MSMKKAACLALALFCVGAAGGAPAVVLRVVPAVAAAAPARRLYEKQISASGTIVAQNEKEIYLDTPVIASDVQVAVGDRVKKGQVLASINRELTENVLSQSQPASSIFSSGELSQADAGELLGLYSALQGAGLGAGLPDTLEALAQNYQSAAEKSAAPDYIYIPDVITAPMDGIVTQVNLKSDVLSRSASPVITLSDAESFAAMVTVGESNIGDVRVGDKAVLTGTGFGDKSYEGYVSKIYPAARKTGAAVQETVVDVVVAIAEPDEELKAGFTARAKITTGQQREILTVPYEAVLQDEKNIEYVYLAADGRAVRQDVETGLELADGVEIVKGLTGEELVVADASLVPGEGALLRLQGEAENAA